MGMTTFDNLLLLQKLCYPNTTATQGVSAVVWGIWFCYWLSNQDFVLHQHHNGKWKLTKVHCLNEEKFLGQWKKSNHLAFWNLQWTTKKKLTLWRQLLRENRNWCKWCRCLCPISHESNWKDIFSANFVAQCRGSQT